MIAAAVVAASFPGCFSPDLDVQSCEVTCVQECMPGLKCQDGYCVRHGDSIDCRAATGKAGAGGMDGFSAGSQPEVPAPFGGDGGRGMAGSGGESGGEAGETGGVGTGGDGELRISVPAAIDLCSGQRHRIPLRARGGTAPYRWRLDDAAPGLELRTDEGDEIELDGEASEPGAYSVTVTVEDADRGSTTTRISISVFEPPRVLTETLGLACLDLQYAAKLEATGGDPATYVWSAMIDEGTGVALDGDTLKGAPARSGDLRLQVSVSDSHCSSDISEVTLYVDDGCPVFVPAELDPPCAGHEFQQRIGIEGDPPGYSIEASSLPPELSFDSETRELSGVLDRDAEVTFEAVDDQGRRFEHTYSLAPRNKCWLCYVSNAGPGGMLNFVDPLSKTRVSLPREQNPSVTDFEFSPDGRFLVYRSLADGAASELTLVRLHDFREQALDFTFVIGFAWAPDSSRLAVIYGSPGATYLGGVALEPVSEPSGGISGLGPVAVSAVPATPKLVWAGNDTVYFPSATPDPNTPVRFLVQAHLEGRAFQEPTTLESAFFQSFALFGFEEGVFAVDPVQSLIGFFASDGSRAALHGKESIAPNGRYTARAVANDVLQVLLPSTVSFAQEAADIDGAGCAAIAAWSEDASHIFCRTPADRMAMYRLPDVAASGTHAVQSIVSGAYSYSSADMETHRRVVSPSGRYMAFVTSSALSVAALGPENPRVVYSEPLPPLRDDPKLIDEVHDDLAFSPDETLILAHRGAHLWLHRYQSDAPSSWQGNTLLRSAEECFEDPLASPDDWCGAAQDPHSFAWFAGNETASQVAVAKVLDGRLLLFVSSGPRGATRFDGSAIDDGCIGECVGRFEFQP